MRHEREGLLLSSLHNVTEVAISQELSAKDYRREQPLAA